MRRFLTHLFIYAAVMAAIITALFFIVPYNADGFMRAQLVKDDMLTQRDSAIVVLLGDSNVGFGFDSHIIQDSIGMPVVNDGLHAGLGTRFIMDNCLEKLRPGDVLIMSHAYNNFFNLTAEGGQPLADLFYLAPRRYGHLLNTQQRLTVLYNTPANLRSRIEYLIALWLMPGYKSVYRLSAMNDRGDIVGHWDDDAMIFNNHTPVITAHETPNEPFIDHMERQVRDAQRRGVTVLFLPAAIERSAYDNMRPNIDYVDSVLAARGMAYMCPTDAVAWPDSLFYDTEYHMRHAGAVKRSQQLVGLLRERGY